MKKILLLIVAVAFSLQLQARTISGKVLSDKDSTAVTGAVCQILSGDRNLAGTTADASGKFSINSEFRGKMTLEITMPGFNPHGNID